MTTDETIRVELSLDRPCKCVLYAKGYRAEGEGKNPADAVLAAFIKWQTFFGDLHRDLTRELGNAIRDRDGYRAAYEKAASRIVEQSKEIEGLRAFKRSVDQALNSGDGSYRP
jgi:hypothetical protein